MKNYHDANPKQEMPWLSVTIVILLIPIAVSVYLSWRDSEADVKAPLDMSCDLHHGSCQSSFPDGGTVSLSIEPRPIQALKHLRIKVQLQGIHPKSVMVDFRGVNMDMGYNRPQLKRVAAGEYKGAWVLASCGLDRMVWEAMVIIETPKLKMAAPFHLVTAKKQ